jgi:hypothetical protein
MAVIMSEYHVDQIEMQHGLGFLDRLDLVFIGAADATGSGNFFTVIFESYSLFILNADHFTSLSKLSKKSEIN